MKQVILLLTSICIALMITSCDKLGGESFTPQTYDVQGKVEKGPFISGSDISIQPMDADLQVTGSMFNTAITDDLGNFVLGSKLFSTPYAEFMANGYFFNEVKGELSNGTLTLRALVDLSDNATVNVNVLTHLKYARIKKLVASGKNFNESNAQAQEELLNAFGLGRYSDKDVSSFSIIAGTEESAALIAISSLLLMERSEAALTEYLSKLSADFGEDGCFSEEMQHQMDADQDEIASNLSDIKEHIIERYSDLGISVEVKDLNYYFDWDKDGVAGNELLKENEVVLLEDSVLVVPNDGGTYHIQIQSPIALYLSPQVDGTLEVMPGQTITPDNFLGDGLYSGHNGESLKDKEISAETSLENSILNITVSALSSRTNKTKFISLYDYVGHVVATVEIRQEGKILDVNVAEAPLLGSAAEQVVASAAYSLARAMGSYNLIEQYYQYNPLMYGDIRMTIDKTNSTVADAWSYFYEACSKLLLLKKADEAALNVYADYCHVLLAMIYSNLIYGWDGVPYIAHYDMYEFIMYDGLPRVSPSYIFDDLKDKLQTAINRLPEKKNESLKDVNGFFFCSKDVARVLLANIYMYEGYYAQAKVLLQQVISNGFYCLDASTNFFGTWGEVVIDGVATDVSPELIFALHGASATRSTVSIYTPNKMPCMTLSDVYLSLAECYYFLEDATTADTYVQSIIDAKSLEVNESSVLMKIKAVRERLLLHSGTYFAFLKRSGLAKEVCGIEDYQLLFPIPQSEMYNNRQMTQNPYW